MVNLKDLSGYLADKEKSVPTNSAVMLDSKKKEKAMSMIEEAMEMLKSDGVEDPMEFISDYMNGDTDDYGSPMPEEMEEKPKKGRLIVKQLIIEKLKKGRGKEE